jgi:aryl-alcohol dehydrogenase-like predicted oxidoreductase
MGLSEFYAATDETEALAVLHAAFEVGYRHFDTADMYGRGHNEELLGRFVASLGPARRELTLATKFGIRRHPTEALRLEIDSSPTYVRQACEASLRRLRVECIDLYYLHRRNREVPIEDTVGTMADLQREGKIIGIGLSEVSRETLRRASAVAKVSALQSEYSLWTRDVEAELLGVCAALEVSFVAYSPLGRGFLSGSSQLLNGTIAETDLRSKLPRFTAEHRATNSALVEHLAVIAAQQGVTTSQLALAWLLQKQPSIHAIPGTRNPRYLIENFAALQLELSAPTVSALEQLFAAGSVSGARYPEGAMKTVNA